LGEGVVEPATVLASDPARQPWRIPVLEHLAFEDLKHDWLTGPILDLYGGLEALAGIDVESDAVGRQLRPAAGRLLEQGAQVRELLEFLICFDGDLVQMIVDAAADGLKAFECAAIWMVGADPQAADAAGRVAGETFHRIATEHEVILRGLPLATAADLGIDTPNREDAFRHLFAVSESVKDTWHQTCVSLVALGYDLADLGARQLPYLDAYPESGFAESYLRLAWEIGTSSYPLLAHRAAYLTHDLLNHAFAADRLETGRRIAAFLVDQAGWITAAGPRYKAALDRYLDDDDKPSIVEAYRLLAEGILRPYATLVHILAKPGTAPITLYTTLGEVEGGLTRTDVRIADLLLRFVEPVLRNADAHANVAVAASGDVIVRLSDGSSTPLNPNHVYGKAVGLRAALVGVDVAVNLAFTKVVTEILPPSEPYRPKVVSEAILLHWARLGAEEFTAGSVTGVEIGERALRLTFVGTAGDDELRAMVVRLAALVSEEVDSILVVSESGALLAELRLSE
jgi:hypothetical protein